jgi:hypothetical protein
MAQKLAIISAVISTGLLVSNRRPIKARSKSTIQSSLIHPWFKRGAKLPHSNAAIGFPM